MLDQTAFSTVNDVSIILNIIKNYHILTRLVCKDNCLHFQTFYIKDNRQDKEISVALVCSVFCPFLDCHDQS